MFDNTFQYAIVAIGSVLVAITLHEAMHAYASYWLGDDTAKYEGRLSLNPWRHIDPLFTLALPVFLALSGLPVFGAAKPVPFNPSRLKWDEFGAALVGLAGPLTNLVLAALGAGLIKILIGVVPVGVLEVLAVFVSVNIGFFVFNMIPFPPLDGSRALYALAPEPVRNVMEQIEAFGVAGILIFMLVLFRYIQPALVRINESIFNFLLS